ncbi:hypothetical protein ABG067_007636, partial [Albugo candida]
PEVGSGNGHVEDLLEMYSSPDGNRAPCDRKEQDDAANGADRVSRQIDQNQRQHLRLQRGAHSSSYRQNKRILSQKATPNDQIVVPLLQENELLYSSVKDEKSTSLPTSSVTTRLPELRTMSTVLRTNSVSNITLPAHLTRSDSPGLTPHGKRSMNIQDILAYTGHNVKRLRTRIRRGTEANNGYGVEAYMLTISSDVKCASKIQIMCLGKPTPFHDELFDGGAYIKDKWCMRLYLQQVFRIDVEQRNLSLAPTRFRLLEKLILIQSYRSFKSQCLSSRDWEPILDSVVEPLEMRLEQRVRQW